MQKHAQKILATREFEREFAAADRLLRARRRGTWNEGKARMAELARAGHLPAVEAMVEIELEERALVRAEGWAWTALERGLAEPLAEVAWTWVYGRDGWRRSRLHAPATRGRNPRRGLRLLERAARLEYSGACNWLAFLLDEPSPLGRDERAAITWTRRGAALGNLACTTRLGVKHFHGQGVPRSVARAVAYYRRAASRGSGEAAHNLGLCYLHGDGVPRNARTAMRWMKRAEELGNDSGTLQLARFHFEGLGGPRDARKGLACLRRAQKSTWRADRELARRKLWGDGLRRDVRAGLATLRARVRAEDTEAMVLLGDWLHDERRKYAEAVRLYRRAAELGNSNAMWSLHDCLGPGHGRAVPQDVAQALRWLDRAVALGDEEALHRLGEHQVRGVVVRKDVRRGLRNLERAIELGSVEALRVKGELLLERARSRVELRRALDLLLDARSCGVEDVERPIRECRRRLR